MPAVTFVDPAAGKITVSGIIGRVGRFGVPLTSAPAGVGPEYVYLMGLGGALSGGIVTFPRTEPPPITILPLTSVLPWVNPPPKLFPSVAPDPTVKIVDPGERFDGRVY